MRTLSRKDFMLGFGCAGASVLLGLGCSDPSETSPGGETSSGGGGAGGTGSSAGGSNAGGTLVDAGSCGTTVVAQITCRHDHELIVSAADLAAGQTKIYNIQGANLTHGHDVEVTAAMFASLKAGQTVEIAVPSQFQAHTVYLTCAAVDPAARDLEACN
jgi:hypothetical protein